MKDELEKDLVLEEEEGCPPSACACCGCGCGGAEDDEE